MTPQKSQLRDLLTLSCFGKIGPRGFAKLSAVSNGNVHDLKPDALIQAGIKPTIADEFRQFVAQFSVDAELEKIGSLGIALVAIDDPAYPPLLHEITDPPYLLYAKGTMAALHHQSIAVVGSRKHTHYGDKIIEILVPELASRGVVIVSGLAYGIDALGHRAALTSGGITAAVIGCGLDRMYPSDHSNLAIEMVAKGGVIFSEYALGTPPLRQHFPARNRLIAGVSSGTLVVECDVESGAMITAHHALDQNRDVFAVPGPITSPLSAGPNALLRMGAFVVLGVADVLDHLGLSEQSKPSMPPVPATLPDHERTVFEVLTDDPMHVDDILQSIGLEIGELNSALLYLEMKGLIRNVGAAQYVKR